MNPQTTKERSLAVRIIPPIIAFIVSVAAWEIISRTETVNPIILPPPSDIFVAFVDLIGQEYFWNAVRVTMIEVFAGFAIGCGIGLILGALIGMSSLIRVTLYPYAIIFNNLPRIALAPIFLTWFGFGLSSKIALAATICFFPALIAVVVGIDTVSSEAKTLMRSYGASRLKTFRSLTLPSSLPHIFAGLVNGMSLALIGAIVAEFVGASEGLGVLIKTFNFQLNVAESFAVIIALGVLGLGLFGIMEYLYRRIVFWHDH